jgi:hypothetical protein
MGQFPGPQYITSGTGLHDTIQEYMLYDFTVLCMPSMSKNVECNMSYTTLPFCATSDKVVRWPPVSFL